uniref:Peptidase S1 domain-containing protein n=1 Tax=Rhodosorus marinus TaxID=101924 RepID=A0A7S3EFC6_9RHOD|mmetsp:Transcript_29787/g.114375  ORF Transcript_29787/g.114375 Transcript_29787/m.114375 type:complete len:493 (+) Transcript_29787:129-1607(+)
MNTLLVFLVALALSMTSAAPVGRLPERIAATVDLTDKFSAISIDNLGMQRIDNVSVEKKDGKGSHAFPSDILDWNSVRGILSSLESSMAPEHISLEPRYITFENTTNSNIVLVDDPTVIDMAGDKNWSSSRIYNGAIVQNDDIFANVGVMVAIDDQNNVLGTTCTGSIVDENIVLSAAHCVDDLPAGVRLAMCAGTKDFFANHGVCALITEAIIPSQYSLETLTIGNDLAILKLSRPMTGIPIMKVSFDLPPAGLRSLAIGFGLSAPGMDNPDGRMRYGDTVVVPSGQCGFLQRGGLAGDPDLICSNGNHDGSRGTACNGDSGGPLLVPGNTPSEHIVIGVASYVAKFQDGSCDPGHENVYASLTSTAHKNFIRESVAHFGGSLTFAQISGGGNPPPAQSQPPSPPQQTPPQQTQPPSQSGSCQQRFNACRPELLTCLENNLTSSCCDATIPVIQCLIPVLQACGNPGGANNLRGVLGQLFDVCPTTSGTTA